MIAVNEYFDGKVKSLGFQNQDGTLTSGVMLAGEYEFGTSCKEYMTLISGEWQVQLPNSDTFVTYAKGTTFEVPANCKFQLKVQQTSAYLCAYE
jgi:purine/pyrimidine-nucleoside phosphorylase